MRTKNGQLTGRKAKKTDSWLNLTPDIQIQMGESSLAQLLLNMYIIFLKLLKNIYNSTLMKVKYPWFWSPCLNVCKPML